MVDIRKNLVVRNFFLQAAAENLRACLNGMSRNPAVNNQAIPFGSRHLIMRDSLVRNLNEIFVSGQTTALSFGGASVAQVIKMMEIQNKDQLDTLILKFGTNDISRSSVTPESRWEPLLVCLLNELKDNNKHHKMYRQFSKPPGQTPGEYSRDYPRATSVKGDDRRYKGLDIPNGDSLFAAYDPLTSR